MWRFKKLKSARVLMLLSLSCLSSCAAANYEAACPVYPVAGKEVAREIENITGGAFWEWLARINKLRQELELCRQS